MRRRHTTSGSRRTRHLFRSAELPEDLGPWGIFDVLPTLVPEQEWSTVWEDDSAHRVKSDLPQAHDVTVLCRDSRGRKMKAVTFRLDWTAHKYKIFRVVNGPHEVHAELEKIRKELARVASGRSRVRVLTESEAEHRAQQSAEREEMLRVAGDGAAAEQPLSTRAPDSSVLGRGGLVGRGRDG